MIDEKNSPTKNDAGAVPPPQDEEYTVDDLKTTLEESERSLHDAVFIAHQVWEKDCNTVKFDIDNLVQIESALQKICNIIAGVDSRDDGGWHDTHTCCGNCGAHALFRTLIYAVLGLYPKVPALF